MRGYDRADFMKRVYELMSQNPTWRSKDCCQPFGISPQSFSIRIKNCTGQHWHELFPLSKVEKSASEAAAILRQIALTNPWLTTEEAADYAGVHRNTVQNLIGKTWAEATGIDNDERRKMRSRMSKKDALRPCIIVPKELTMQIRPYKHTQEVYRYV